MVGNDFYYDGHWLSEFGMRVYDPDDIQQFAGRDIDKADITPIRPIPNHYSTHYSNVLTLSFLIIKTDEDDTLPQIETKMDGEDINDVRAWLESPKKPKELQCPTADEVVTTTYYGLFTDIKPYLLGNECFGLYLTFTCNAPYGFSDIFRKRYIMLSGVTVDGYFSNYSAEYGEYLKPVITINSATAFASDETIDIVNVTDGNKHMFLTMPEGATSITIDCQKKTVVDNDGNIIPLSALGVTVPVSTDYNFISTELYSFYWLRLLPKKNSLQFTTLENSTINTVIIEARYIIKSGGF